MTPERLADLRAAGLLDRLAAYLAPRLGTLGGRGTIAAPLLIVLVVSLVTAVATRVWGWDLVFPEPPPPALRTVFWVVAGLSPWIALVKGGLLALAAWAVLVLLGTPGRLRAVLSAVLYGEAILALQGPLLLLTLVVQGGAREGDVPAPTGLDFFVAPGHPLLLAFAHAVTPVHVAWVAFLALAFSACARSTRRRGMATAGFLWILTTGLSALHALLNGSTS
jgi:hypothetical protein